MCDYRTQATTITASVDSGSEIVSVNFTNDIQLGSKIRLGFTSIGDNALLEDRYVILIGETMTNGVKTITLHMPLKYAHFQGESVLVLSSNHVSHGKVKEYIDISVKNFYLQNLLSNISLFHLFL